MKTRWMLPTAVALAGLLGFPSLGVSSLKDAVRKQQGQVVVPGDAEVRSEVKVEDDGDEIKREEKTRTEVNGARREVERKVRVQRNADGTVTPEVETRVKVK